uniref:Uncharacterized protein n=1 Tax=Rhizophora mucronata TaxID=61149 RepID=A0A2P2P836_RHIMU
MKYYHFTKICRYLIIYVFRARYERGVLMDV